MTITREMLQSHPQGAGDIDVEVLAACLDACLECAGTCALCSEACLSEDIIKTDPEIIELCDEIDETQQEEIAQMKAILDRYESD